MKSCGYRLQRHLLPTLCCYRACVLTVVLMLSPLCVLTGPVHPGHSPHQSVLFHERLLLPVSCLPLHHLSVWMHLSTAVPQLLVPCVYQRPEATKSCEEWTKQEQRTVKTWNANLSFLLATIFSDIHRGGNKRTQCKFIHFSKVFDYNFLYLEKN